jgi:hypothetical protein
MSAITFRIQGPPAAVEQSAAGLKEIFGLITEPVTQSGAVRLVANTPTGYMVIAG